MSAKKHTPGPWLRDDRSGLDCDVRAASGRKVALCWGLASNNATNYRADYRAECDANAHLIAAAPELLDALRAFLRAPSVGSAGPGAVTIAVQDFNLRAARAAIAKATGEPQ